MHLIALGGGLARRPPRPRTLLACAGAVWMWPGIALTRREGARITPLSADTVHFWITRLHGPEALYLGIGRGLDRAADHLAFDDQAAAQRALDAIGLTRLSEDGATLMRSLAAGFGLAPLDLAKGHGPSLWRPGDLAAQIALFERSIERKDRLAKFAEWDEAEHPRWPAGAPDHQGGRFRDADEDAEPIIEGRSASSGSTPPGKPPAIQLPPIVVSPDADPPRGIGDNGGPPLEDPPDIPQIEPPTAKLRNAFIKAAARWALRAAVLGALPEVGAFLLGFEAAWWLYNDCYPYIRAYLDPPKTLEELQEDAKFPEKGYDVHHIVEKKQAERDGFDSSFYEAPENLVRIPTLKHWQITGWYMTKNEKYGGLSPRDYLKGKSWEVKRQIGLEVLRKFGVLKP